MEENKELDDFIRKSVKELGLEKPSVDFTDTVLSKIHLESQKTVLRHQPLFSKTTWFVVLSLVSFIFVYAIFGGSGSESTLLAAVELNKLTSINLSLNLPKFSLPAAFIYGSVVVTFFVWIQVFLVKKQLDKRYITG